MTNGAPAALAELKVRLQEIYDLNGAVAVLYWDESTHMPEGGAAGRGRQIATLQSVIHSKFTAPEIGRLLDQLEPYRAALADDHDDAALLRVSRRDYDRATKVPAAFVSEAALHSSAGYEAWAKARPTNDAALILPFLEKTVDLRRRYADFFPGYQHVADPLIDGNDPGMTVALLRPLFARLRDELSPMVATIATCPVVDDELLHRHYPEAHQWAFGEKLAAAYGYDFNRGGQAKTRHPFCVNFSIDDVRITTRIDEHDLAGGLFSTLHESGHAMYEQGVGHQYSGTPLASGTSSGVHESQSRLWENMVGRSHGLWQHYYPDLQALYPDALGDIPLDNFYKAINKVQPSLIRTEADEVTYNLHVIIRFELELDVLEGKLAVRDIPEEWHARYQKYLGVHSPDHRNGFLQDVHWFQGDFGGGFQGYTLGNVMAGQIYAAALAAHPSIPTEIAAGHFATLKHWLTQEIYTHGRKYEPAELIQRVTGRPLEVEPYLAYLRTKFGALYDVTL